MGERYALFGKIGKGKKSGDNSGEDTPVPISNTVVKLSSADDTWRGTAWESRTLPVFLKRGARKCFFFLSLQHLGNFWQEIVSGLPHEEFPPLCFLSRATFWRFLYIIRRNTYLARHLCLISKPHAAQSGEMLQYHSAKSNIKWKTRYFLQEYSL